jgi:LuxR family maltose regulon positive regulatory protein
MTAPLLTTKLYIPPPRPRLVARPRLLERLNAGLHLGRKLTLVSAPAGFGKSTLLSAWAARCERPVAWISLDKGDNEPQRFLAYLVAALQTIPGLDEAGVGRSVLAALQPADLVGTAPDLPLEPLLTALINELGASDAGPFLLILDDFHLIEDRAVHGALTFFLENLPPPPRGMHLVLAGRADPPWPLARLRARGEVTELRTNDLRFTTEEVAAFLNRVSALGLSPEHVAMLRERTEGWIAGLQMAALAMQGTLSQPSHNRGGEAATFIEAFRGTHRFILDYLMEEVLSQQPPAIQEFLLQTSILEQMTGPLCEAVCMGLPEARGQAILEELEQANLFLMPLDHERQWYRYHSLFADLLKSSLRQSRSAEQIRELHRRASQWHQEQGLLEEAVQHTMAAQDYARAVSMLEQNLLAMLYRSGAPTFLGWIEQLPEALIHQNPWMDIYRAWTLAHTSQLDQADGLLQEVEKRLQPGEPASSDLLGSMAAIRAYMANLRGQLDQALELAHQANDQLFEDNLRVRASVAYTLADTYFARDDMDGAGQAWSEMIELGTKADRPLLTLPAMCNLANVKKVQGRLHEANDLYATILQLMLEQDALDSRVRMSYEIGLGDLLYEWNDLQAARDHVMVGLEYCQRFGVYITHLVLGHILLMRVLQAQGESEAALEALGQAEAVVRASRIQQGAILLFEAWRVRQWLAVGDLEAASRWVDESGGQSELEQMARARVRLAQGRADEALRLLDRQAGAAQEGRRAGRLIEILVLQAVSLQAQGRHDQALAALGGGLTLARPEGYMRLFVDEGAPMAELLRQAAAQGIAATRGAAGRYVGQLLTALKREGEARKRRAPVPLLPVSLPAQPLPDPLTERELEVLQLLGVGLSNKEIAETLVIALSTVKQHLKNIYAKLDVHSRTQAVAQARELGLL